MTNVDRKVLRNAQPFNWYIGSDAPEVAALATAIAAEFVMPTRKRRFREGEDEKLEDTIKSTILNLFSAWFQNEDRWVFYPRDKNWIDSNTTHSSLHFLSLIDAVQDRLTTTINGERGVGLWDEERQRRMRSRMKARPPLIRLFKQYGINSRMIGTTERFDIIRLRDANKDPISLPNDPESRRIISSASDNLNEINDVIKNTFIGLRVSDSELSRINARLSNDPDSVPLNTTKKTLFRVYNNGRLTEGGRFFGGWWQDIPAESRAFIHISTPTSTLFHGEPMYTKEIDYKSMFPSIAYGLLGIPIEDSAYRLEGVTHNDESKKVIKTCMVTMLMANSAQGARTAVHRELEKKRLWEQPLKHKEAIEKRNRQQRHEDPKPVLKEVELLPEGFPRLTELIGQLETKHTLLMHEGFFYNKVQGRELMKLESDIAESVMLHFARAYNIPVLPIHDSFIVPHKYVGGPGIASLETVMKEKFREHVGVDCQVTFDTNYREITQPRASELDEHGILIPRSVEEDCKLAEVEKLENQTYFRHLDDWYTDN